MIEIDLVQLKKMKVSEAEQLCAHSSTDVSRQVPELRKQAAELGLETKGTKAEILSRIEKYLKEQGLSPAARLAQMWTHFR